MFPSNALLAWYAQHGRTHLPWRRTRDPYRIVVSEAMLQQTQVERVIPLYEAFVARFPTIRALAEAQSADVVRAWRGLGYNSRALRLHALARAIVERHGGVVPHLTEALRALPGVGAYTASAIRAFAFELDDAAVDVNLRRVVHRVVFGIEYPPLADDRRLDVIARAGVPHDKAHDWNSAMMDLGAMLCRSRTPKCLVCPLRDQCAAAPIDPAGLAERMRAHPRRRSPQNSVPFRRTNRFVRGRIIDRLRDVPTHETLALDVLLDDIAAIVPADRGGEIRGVLASLASEGIIIVEDHRVRLR